MWNMDRSKLILDTIEKNPGIRFREIMHALNLRNGVLSHHLDKLEKKSVIKVERTPRVARFYPLGITDFEAVISKRLRQETPRRILQLLLDLSLIHI